MVRRYRRTGYASVRQLQRRTVEYGQGFDHDHFGYPTVLMATLLAELLQFDRAGIKVAKIRLTEPEMEALRSTGSKYRFDEDSGLHYIWDCEVVFADALGSEDGRFWVDDDELADD